MSARLRRPLGVVKRDVSELFIDLKPARAYGFGGLGAGFIASHGSADLTQSLAVRDSVL